MDICFHSGPYFMLTKRYVVKAIRYDKSVSKSANRYALKRVTIREMDLCYAAIAVRGYLLTRMRL